jgi:lipid-A-disaccharide synthase
MPGRVFLSIGDVSARNYVYEIFKEGFEEFELAGITDEKLEKIGIKSTGKIEDISVTGVVEVLPRILKIRKTFFKALKELETCDALIACDAPGFNLRLIKEAKKRGVKKVIYFISPQVWAWKSSRAEAVARYSDHIVLILPFEVEIYKRFRGLGVHYEGHPLIDLVKKNEQTSAMLRNMGLEGSLLLMPGSRWSEIKKHAQFLKSLVVQLLRKKDIPVAIPTFEPFSGFLRKTFKGTPVRILTEEEMPTLTYSLMSISGGGFIASGTASLECALSSLPHAIFYRTSPITVLIAKFLLKIDSINLPNIILDKKTVPELINPSLQESLEEVVRVLEDPSFRAKQKEDFGILKRLLGSEGVIERLRNLFLELLS